MINFEEKIFNEVLTTGAGGMVGSYVDFGIKMTHRSLDVTDLNETLKVVRKYKPKVILHLAAETDVDRCDRDPQHAYMVNSIATYNLAVAAKEVGAKLIYISTSAVFDGFKKDPYIETDIPNPQGYYGRSKYLGEVFVKELLEDYIIARICWVFGGGPNKDQKFVAKMIQQMDNPEIKVVEGKYGSPTYGKDLIEALKKMILEDKKGIYHMANRGQVSREDLTREIAKIVGSEAKIDAVDESYFSKVHTDKRLDNESMNSSIDIVRPWQEGLKDYIEVEWSNFLKK